MAGRRPAQAVQNYLRPLQLALSCVTDAVLVVSGGYRLGQVNATTFGGTRATLLKGEGTLALHFIQNYEIIAAQLPLGPYKVTCRRYIDALEDAMTQEEIISFHWHPDIEGISTPHIHLGTGARVGLKQLQKAHIPSGRIAIEDVIHLAVREFGVAPLRQDWRAILNSTRDKFIKYRSWA